MVNLNDVTKRLTGHFLAAFLFFNALSISWVALYAFIPIPVTKLMLIEGHEQDVRYEWRSLENISDVLELAVMCAEDQQFILHHGFDLTAIERATMSNSSGRKLKGASTLTQQVAKNVFLWPDRTWLRKGLEAYYTLLVEIMWSKERIMEVYLNIAKYGIRVFGAESASQYYFNKSSDQLTMNEAASLAALLPNPKNYSIKKPSRYIEGRIRWIEHQMNNWGTEMTYDKTFAQKMQRPLSK